MYLKQLCVVKDGVLTISIPKVEEKKTKVIEVSVK